MRTLLLAALLSLLPALALADTPARDNNVQTDDCARARKAHKTCELTIGEETIDGHGVTATGSGLSVRQFASLDSLIHIRRDFIPEIVKAAEDID